MKTARPVQSLSGERERQTRLLTLVDGFGRRRVAVVGDIVADEFLTGQISRVSREAPVLILRYDATRIVPGGGGNAANNVAALGGRVDLFGLLGNDEAGRALRKAFPGGVRQTGVMRSPGYRTPTKTRVLAGGIHSAKQQIVRIDREPSGSPSADVVRAFTAKVLDAIDDADAVLLSDYGYGLVTPALAEAIDTRLKRSARRRHVPVLVDSRYNLGAYRGLSACTPNEPEVEQLLGVRINDDPDTLERAGRAMLRRQRMQAVLITRGSRGMALFEPKAPTVHIPIFGSDEIADVTGAGDTVMATMALALATGASFDEAARLANYAGGIVVMKRGTATVSADELRQAVISDLSA
ncbi:MAG TPA: PfkB family carbohydrate kinase [Vicinamibacterales bacterium]|jgi:rfaE bifunctional protein kinase chain/domain